MKIRLGPEFKKYLSDNFITVNSLADELGFSRQGLHKIVTGKTKRPYNSTLTKLADYLNLALGSDKDGVYFDTDVKRNGSGGIVEIDRSGEILSNKIMTVLAEKGLSISELASQIGKPEKTTKKYLNSSDPVMPDIPTLKKIAQALEVSVDFLISDDQSELKKKILEKLRLILEEEKNQAVIQFKRRLPKDPEERSRRLRRLLDVVEVASPEGLDFFEFLTSMECLLIEDEWVMPHLQQLTSDYLAIKDIKNLWQINNYKELTIVAATSTTRYTGEYEQPATGIGQVRALAILSESLTKGYGHLSVNNIYLSRDSLQDRLETDLILLGGTKNNQLTKAFLKEIEDKQPAVQIGSAIHWRKKQKGKWHESSVHSGRIEEKQVIDDYGLIVRCRNPFTFKNKTIVLLAGSHTYGVIAAAKYFAENMVNDLDFETLKSNNLTVLVKAKVMDEYPVSLKVVKSHKW